MATISKNISRLGFCVIDNAQVPIPIEYISFPDDGSTRKKHDIYKEQQSVQILV